MIGWLIDDTLINVTEEDLYKLFLEDIFGAIAEIV